MPNDNACSSPRHTGPVGLPPAKQEKCLTIEPRLEPAAVPAAAVPPDQHFACFYPDGELDADVLSAARQALTDAPAAAGSD